MREQFTFYRSFWEAIKRLKKKDDRLSALEAIIAYALDDEERDMTDVAEGIYILIKPTLDSSRKKASNGATGGKQTASKPKANRKQTASEKEGEKEGEGEIENECYHAHARVASRFLPPSVDDVAAYCRERQNDIDAQAFVDFYASKGWKVGSSPMKDWKAAVRTWEQRKDRRGGNVFMEIARDEGLL